MQANGFLRWFFCVNVRFRLRTGGQHNYHNPYKQTLGQIPKQGPTLPGKPGPMTIMSSVPKLPKLAGQVPITYSFRAPAMPNIVEVEAQFACVTQ